MASRIFPKCREQMWQGGINAASGNVKAVIVDTAQYTYSATHEFLSDIPAGARLGTTANLANKSFTNGVFDADDPPAIAGGIAQSGEAIVHYIDTGNAATSRLLVYTDSAQNAALPLPATGADILLQWDNGANKIAALNES